MPRAPSNISVLFTNIRSVVRNHDSISCAADTTAADIIVLTETWLNESVRDSEIFSAQKCYNIFRCDRSSKRGGGVLVAVNHNFECSQVNVTTNLEFTCVQISVNFTKFLLCVCYRPPSTPLGFCNDLHDTLNTIHIKFSNQQIFLFGDFNFPDVNWQSPAISSEETCESSNFVALCSTFSLTQVITEPTRITDSTSNTLDLLLTTAPDLVTDISYLPKISDHSVIHVMLNVPTRLSHNNPKVIYDYGKANFSAINDGLKIFLDEFLVGFDERSVTENWHLFKSTIHNLIKHHIPQKVITTNRQFPWFSRALKRLANKKRRFFIRAKRSRKSEHWSALKDVVCTYKKALKQAKHKFMNVTLPELLSANPKKFWSLIKDTDDSTISLVDLQSNRISNADCAAALNDTFAKAFSSCTNSSLPACHTHYDFPMDPVHFDFDGIVRIIESLKLSSSCGPDDINTKVLKNTSVYSAIILSKIFNQSLQSGEIPDDWKIGKVIPLHKSGDKHSASNYRPISLTSISCKIFEHVIASHLAKFLESFSFFSPEQHGFRKLFSCETQLVAFTNDLHSVLDNGSAADCIFIDFCKAFDKVPHSLLLHKLSQLNIDPNVLKWIKCFLTDRSQFVHVNGFNSSTLPVTSGVPQGSVLGPLLFLIYINDLPSNLTSSVKLFADDCVIYREIKNATDVSLLQQDLDAIDNWCSTWHMTLNINKCKVMRFSRQRKLNPSSYSISSSPLLPVSSYKYLGVILTADLSWNMHVSSIILNANRTLGFIRRHFSLAPASVKLLLYKSLVRSKLEYASSVWDPCNNSLINALEATQNRASRFILHDYGRLSSVTQMKATLSLEPLTLRRKISRMCLFFKIYKLNATLKTALILPPAHVSLRIDHSCKVGIPKCRTVSYSNSFIPRTTSEWNRLPPSLVLTNNIDQFRKKVSDYFTSV